MWVSLTRGLEALCVWIVCIVVTSTSSASEHVTIDLEEAIGRTLARNPNLVAFGYQMEAQRGRLTQSELRPNVELGVVVENVLGAGDFTGVDGAEATFSLAWVLEHGKRNRRIAAASAGVSLVESQAEIVRLDAAAETARRFLASSANQERLKRTREAVESAEQTVTAVAERVRAGRTPDADLARAEAHLARVRLAHEDIEHELITSMHRLSAQWGETQPSFDRVVARIDLLPGADGFAALLVRIEQNPDLSTYFTEHRLREAELRLAEAQAKPNWRLSAGIRRLERTSDQAFVAGITIPLATRNRNQGRIAEARAKLSRTDAEKTAKRIELETRLYVLYQEYQHSLHRISVLAEEVMPRIEKALADTQTAYSTGRYGYLELQLAQTEVLEARTALVEARVNANERLIEIERLTGTTLSSSITQR